MRARLLILALVLTFGASLSTSAPFVLADEPDSQEVAISDTRTGSAPCGFAVQRELTGTVDIAPRVDEQGNLVLAISGVDMRGTLTNPENGKSVEIKWVHQNGHISITSDGGSIDLLIGLDGTLFRGYDTAQSELVLNLPDDGTTLVAFTPGDHHDDPWAHVCSLLA